MVSTQQEPASLVDGLPAETSHPKLCINCNHCWADAGQCMRNIKKERSVSLVTGREYVLVGDLLECERERMARTASMAEKILRFMKGIEVGQMSYGSCGPEAKFFQPKVKPWEGAIDTAPASEPPAKEEVKP